MSCRQRASDLFARILICIRVLVDFCDRLHPLVGRSHNLKMKMNRQSTNNRSARAGPSFTAPGLWIPVENPGHLLTAEERAFLATIATIVRYKKKEEIYREGADADAVYNIVSGVVKSYRTLPNQEQHIVGFLFPGDLFGLVENGKYVNSAAAVTPVTLHRIPPVALESRLRRSPTLDFQVISKLCHELRATQRHAFILSRHRATTKVAVFLEMLETQQAGPDNVSLEEIYLPMSRIDMGDYLGISPETVSRSLRKLVSLGAITLRDHRHIKITNRTQLAAVVSETLTPCGD
jgi:CRP-like cAMP-binding protein